ncbi:hypothetical protein R2360_01665 [Mycobacteroides chelonae]|uniref:hypothetical protein n=1 Tax=Mycobacteroides chelonae TaxID=1774 RepID=UPI0023B1BFBA|nr:hypothetical protein [Mycobacteroides chelonae]MEC4838427.1 hypothetical protein [Mycobacteroides chelonae]MEC4845480.1 hypothetical protein [Mycobacteroides chelonae]WED90290.1 hypothetical protein PXJ67_15680 [Mycobacteroides chelonae]WED97488.1 hypothetical protein PYW02_02775 [Mycobacteroides chelonae]
MTEPMADNTPVETGDTTQPEPNNREARYRVERNEAREQLAAAELALVQLQTRELHRLAGDILSAPEDIALSGKPLSDFLTPEGWVDKGTVEKVAQEVAQARPGLAKTSPAYDLSQGKNGDTPKSANWGSLLTQ